MIYPMLFNDDGSLRDENSLIDSIFSSFHEDNEVFPNLKYILTLLTPIQLCDLLRALVAVAVNNDVNRNHGQSFKQQLNDKMTLVNQLIQHVAIKKSVPLDKPVWHALKNETHERGYYDKT